MKKIAIVLLAMMLLAGCTKKEPTPTPTATPEMTPESTPEVSKDPTTSSALSQVLETIMNDTQYEFPSSMNVDSATLEQLYGVKSDVLNDYAIMLPMMNVHATEIILMEAIDGKLEEVKAAVDQRIKDLEQTWSTYLPDQFELVKNRVMIESGNIYGVVIAEKADKIAEDINAALKK